MPIEAAGSTIGVRATGLLGGLADFAGPDQNLYWPAVRSDGLALPPLEHLLESLVRQQLLEADLPDELRGEIQSRPTVETIALIDERPKCDLCAAVGGQADAMFDAPESREPGAMWANLCEACFVAHSPGALGLGQGQILVTPGDLPWGFQAALGRVVRYWTQQGVTMEYPLRGNPPDELFAIIADNLESGETDELGELAGLIALAHKLVEETIADPARSAAKFLFAVVFEDDEPTSLRFDPAESLPHLGTVVDRLDRRGGPWAMAASPGPSENDRQPLLMAAGCSTHVPVAGLATIAARVVPLLDNGWEYRAASDLLEQIGGQ